MRRNSSLRIACAIAALVLISFVCITCGGSSHSNLSQAQAQAISQEVFSALRSAMVAGLTAPGSAAPPSPSIPEIVERAQDVQPSGCVMSNSGESCNIPITYHGACPKGGTISVSGDFAYALDNSGNGSDSSTLTVTPAACAVDDVTFNGNRA